MLGEKDGSFSTTEGAQVESLARKRPEVVVPTLRVGAADTRHAVEIVAAGAKPGISLTPDCRSVIDANCIGNSHNKRHVE